MQPRRPGELPALCRNGWGAATLSLCVVVIETKSAMGGILAMISEYTILKPDVPRSFEDKDERGIWVIQQVIDRSNPPIKIHNIRWQRSHDWMNYVFSMAHARPGPNQHWLWQVVWFLFELANASFVLAGITLYFAARGGL